MIRGNGRSSPAQLEDLPALGGGRGRSMLHQVATMMAGIMTPFLGTRDLRQRTKVNVTMNVVKATLRVGNLSETIQGIGIVGKNGPEDVKTTIWETAGVTKII